jgi:hypothetical protein
METNNIHVYTNGFLRDSAYHANMRSFLVDYADRFSAAESLTVHLNELTYFEISQPRPNPIDFSADGKAITIVYTTHRYYDSSGKETGKISPIEVYQSVKFLLEKAIQTYATQFPTLT